MSLDKEFENIVETLFQIQNGVLENRFIDESIEDFKNLCKDKKLYFFGVGYYAKVLPKYLKMKYKVSVDGQYDWMNNKEDPAVKALSSSTYMPYKIDELKKNKTNKKIPEISEEDFYKDSENTVVFLNYDNPVSEPLFLYSMGFKHLYYLQTLAPDIVKNISSPKKFDIYDRLDNMRSDYCYSDMDISTIQSVYDYLEDEKSKRVFINLLKAKITSNTKYTQEVYDENTVHYFDSKVMPLTDEEVLVDCGANVGDTIESFLKVTNGKFKHIYSYEPDDINFKRMTDYIQTLDCKDKITPLHCGVGNKDETVYIVNPGLVTTSITKTKTDFKIEVKTIGKTVLTPPTLIKMDIEGYEICALLGAMDMIKKYKPKLALSIYHKFDDLWNIPALVKMWVPEYKISIRQYAFDRTETVLYASVD